jgi:hypothetical protein
LILTAVISADYLDEVKHQGSTIEEEEITDEQGPL